MEKGIGHREHGEHREEEIRLNSLLCVLGVSVA